MKSVYEQFLLQIKKETVDNIVNDVYLWKISNAPKNEIYYIISFQCIVYSSLLCVISVLWLCDIFVQSERMLKIQ